MAEIGGSMVCYWWFFGGALVASVLVFSGSKIGFPLVLRVKGEVLLVVFLV